MRFQQQAIPTWPSWTGSADGAKRVDIANPLFGYKNHLGIDRRHGLIRIWSATDAARHDGRQLASLLDRTNTGSRHRLSLRDE